MLKIPAKIMTVDYVGVHNTLAQQYRSRALSELEILRNAMSFQELFQGARSFDLEDNVQIQCRIVGGHAEAVVIIGATGRTSLSQHACFCTAYGVLAGRIMQLKDENGDAVDVIDHYENDQSYAADIVVCQKTGAGQPKIIETREVKAAMGAQNEKILSKTQTSFYISTIFYNVPFTDRYPHEPGELVLILAMPLVDFRPANADAHTYGMSYTEKFGAWSPEVNWRRIVSAGEDNEDFTPEAQITSKYINSTGITYLLTVDSYMWDGEADSESDSRPQTEIDKEIRYNPFRILPVPMDSCFSGYK